MDITEEENLLIGGDFNIRVRNEDRMISEEEKEHKNLKRVSKDEVISNEGRKMSL